MFSADEEIELFDSDNEQTDELNSLIEEEWGHSWNPEEINNSENKADLTIEMKSNENFQNPSLICTLNVKAPIDVKVPITKKLSSSPLERMELNDHKAGMIGLDKDKINKIIHEASKGSKFYENEKRKEQKTKERIEELRNELLKFNVSDKKRALFESDEILKQLRKTIDLTRTLVHVDMDAFYAAVEIRDNPSLRDVPMAVGGNSMLSTSNYVARKYGVRAAMPGFIAKKLCPHLIIVPLHFDKYRAVSQEICEIFQEYDPNCAPMSLDEAYLDLTDYLNENFYKYESRTFEESKELVEVIVDELRGKILKKTQLTASAGIAPNMMLSKICSDLNKPNGQYYLKPDLSVISDFVSNLPIRKVFGIGKVSEQLLKSLDILTCKDLYEKRDILHLLFSETSYHFFLRVSLGISSNRITHDDRKSMSAERTFPDLSDKRALLKVCHDISKHLANDLLKQNLQGRNITLKYKLSNFVTKTRSKTLTFPISKVAEIYSFAKELLLNEMKTYKSGTFELRLMGVRVSHFVDKQVAPQNTVEQFFKTQSGPPNVLKSEAINVTKIVNESACLVHESNNIKCGEKEEIEMFVTCPVCNISLKNDLITLNSHIDSCLTKQTIKDIVNQENSLIEKRNMKSTEILQVECTKSRKRKSGESPRNSSKKVTLFSFWNKS